MIRTLNFDINCFSGCGGSHGTGKNTRFLKRDGSRDLGGQVIQNPLLKAELKQILRGEIKQGRALTQGKQWGALLFCVLDERNNSVTDTVPFVFKMSIEFFDHFFFLRNSVAALHQLGQNARQQDRVLLTSTNAEV